MARLPHHKKRNILLSRLIASIAQRIRPARKQRLNAASASLPKGSRLQRRLSLHSKSSDRAFFDVLRRRRARPSQLNQRLQSDRDRALMLKRSVVGVAAVLVAGSLFWANLFVQERVTFAGVPYGIINKFWNDKPARTAYFAGDRQGLHDRLKLLGVEADIKAYYRDRFPNEYELDRHIHQIMFDRTGYVGEAYQVNNFGELNPVGY